MRYWFAVVASGSLTAAPPAQPNYDRDVRPILSDNCFRCHGFNDASRQAELRLDVAESAYANHDDLTAIVPGDLARSEVWRRITSSDDDERMPPPETHRVLTDEQKDTIRLWIEQGAKYTQHWSFIPPVKAKLPAISDETWPANEIDRFVLARLDAEHLKPSHGADRRTLDPPTVARPDRPAAHRRRSRSLRRRPGPERLRTPRRPPARQPTLRRTDGPRLARRRPLRRHQRLLDRRRPPHVAVARLGHRRLQPQPAVRPVSRASSSPAISCRTTPKPNSSPPAFSATT